MKYKSIRNPFLCVAVTVFNSAQAKQAILMLLQLPSECQSVRPSRALVLCRNIQLKLESENLHRQIAPYSIASGLCSWHYKASGQGKKI